MQLAYLIKSRQYVFAVLHNNLRSRFMRPSIGARRFITNHHALVDSFGRMHNYLRISLTEKCNLRCRYCMPENGVDLTSTEKLLTLDERKRIISIFAKFGVNKLRFTGGEPTISKDLIPLIEHARSLYEGNIKSVALTSNGIILNQQLPSLKQAGLTSVNISLDTFVEKKFADISRREGKLLNRVLSSIFTAQTLDIPVKVNCVVMRGLNDDEMGSFVKFAKEHNVIVRFIELMPFDGNRWDATQFVSYYEMIERIERDTKLKLIKDTPVDKSDTTKWYSIAGSKEGKVGFITSMSSNFCGGCNRLRITADGKLKVCLFGEEQFSIRDSLRDGATEDQIVEAIHRSVYRKKAALGGKSGAIQIAASSNRPMILIGG